MEYWEFLLQREGDQIWLPLESSQVEILEGRYRIMAHTSQLQTPVNIRITQLLIHQMPPKRRVLKRQGQTNQEGLMVVMPFTWLEAGKWEIHCASDHPQSSSEADPSPAASWQHAIQLQVLSHDTEGGTEDGEEWPPANWGYAATIASAPEAPPLSSETSETNAFTAFSPEDAPSATPPQLSETALMAAFQAIDQALAETVANDATASTRGLGLSTSHRLELAQSALMAYQGRDLTVVGQVLATDATDCPQATLGLRLIDPQTGSVLALHQSSLPSQTLPASFAIPVTLPADLNTCLLLGEVVLAVPERDSARVLAIQRFTVTVDLTALFDAIANQAETDGTADVVFPPEAARLPDEGPNDDGEPETELIKVEYQPPPRSIPTLLLPKGGMDLPPRIYYPTPHEVAAHQPTLPFFAAKSGPRSAPSAPATAPDAAATEPVAEEDKPTPTPVAKSGVELPGFIQRSAPINLSGTVKPAADKTADKTVDQTADQTPGKAAADTPADPEVPSPVDAEFRALNLQDRFWNRLNTLAVENYQSAVERKAELDAAGVVTNPDIDAEVESPTFPEAEASPPSPFAGEVVIYDEDPALPDAVEETEAGEDPLLATEPEDLISPPTPILEVPEGELIAGEPVAITLRVPYHLNRTFLKIWITDPQTRTVVEEPRQVMNLSPDGRGNMAAEVRLTVPQGCLDAWFEAISVDMVTSQESYKTIVRRSVVPPDIGTTSLDDFDI